MHDLFDGIRGHQAVKSGLLGALSRGRLHHALLFCGRDGVGKSLVAKRVAQILMCGESSASVGEVANRDLSADGLRACGTCTHCRRIEIGGHPDVLEVSPDGRNIKIAQIRELQQAISFNPFEGRYRVVFIHECHKLLEASSNALLKTLEEPTGQTIFILVTSQPQQLLPTIISRAQIVRFSPFSPEDVASFLVDTTEVEPTVAELVGALSDGSFGRALELSEDDLLDRFDAIYASFDHPYDDPAVILSAASELATKRNELEDLIVLFRTFLRDLAVAKQGLGREHLRLRSQEERIRKLAQRVPLTGIDTLHALLTEIEEGLVVNVNPLLATETLLFAVARVMVKRR